MTTLAPSRPPVNVPGTDLPAHGTASAAMAELLPTPSTPTATKIAFVGVGLKMHFVWADACKAYWEAVDVFKSTVKGTPIEVVAPEEPFEDPGDVLAAVDQLFAEGVRGIVLFHGSYTAGEIASQLARWLVDHPMPLLSWAFPESTGGRLTANSLCCQNFVLNAMKRLDITYQWMFQPIDSPVASAELGRFARSVRARARLIQGKALMVGAGRVPGFYDAECDELAVMKRFGLRYDRLDLMEVMKHGEHFDAGGVAKVRQALTAEPGCGFNNVPDEQADDTIRLALATLDLAAAGGHIGCSIRCWPTLWDHYSCAADGALTLINDQGLPAADENDMLGLLSMLSMHLLHEGHTLPTLMDISLLDAERNRLGFWHCGGSATRLVRAGTAYETRRHSIMENADEETAVGLLVEALLATGPVTVTRYLSPDGAKAFTFEGDIRESPMAFRGSYAECEPADATADQVMGTILDHGMDHHWIIGRGRFAEDLALLNHWLGVTPLQVSNPGDCRGLSHH
ncbi:MAG: fucose isomerase [Planctomycetota bacterium]